VDSEPPRAPRCYRVVFERLAFLARQAICAVSQRQYSKNATKHPDSAVLVFIHVITNVCSYCFLKNFSSRCVCVTVWRGAAPLLSWCAASVVCSGGPVTGRLS